MAAVGVQAVKALAVVGLIVGPAAALAYVAIHEGATGAEDGVLWLIGLATVLALVCALAVALESRFGGDR